MNSNAHENETYNSLCVSTVANQTQLIQSCRNPVKDLMQVEINSEVSHCEEEPEKEESLIIIRTDMMNLDTSKCVKVEKEHRKDENHEMYNSSRLITIANQIHLIHMQLPDDRKGRRNPVKDLMQHMIASDRTQSTFIDKKDRLKEMQELSMIIPNWFQLRKYGSEWLYSVR